MSSTAPNDLRPIIISGPSGVGKGTLIHKLFIAHPNIFATTVSHTTREPRPNEVDGITYFFVSASEFSSLVSQGAFVEYAPFSGHLYGTSKQTIADQTAKGRIVVMDIDMQGAQQIKKDSRIDSRYVFIQPPNLEVLEQRLRDRGTEKEEVIQRRLNQAKNELAFASEPGFYDIVIVNNDLEKAYILLEDFIYS